MKLSLFFSAILICTSSFSQVPSSVNARITGVFVDNTFRVLGSPQLSWKRSNHEISAGPLILLATEIAASDKNHPKLVGAQGHYRLYPLTSTKKINFFLYNDLLFQMIRDRWTSSIWDPESRSYLRYAYEATEVLALNHVGYGFRIQVLKHFLVEQAIGLGMYYSFTDGNELSEGAPSIGDSNVNGYSPIGFSWQIKFGVGFSL